MSWFHFVALPLAFHFAGGNVVGGIGLENDGRDYACDGVLGNASFTGVRYSTFEPPQKFGRLRPLSGRVRAGYHVVPAGKRVSFSCEVSREGRNMELVQFATGSAGNSEFEGHSHITTDLRRDIDSIHGVIVGEPAVCGFFGCRRAANDHEVFSSNHVTRHGFQNGAFVGDRSVGLNYHPTWHLFACGEIDIQSGAMRHSVTYTSLMSDPRVIRAFGYDDVGIDYVVNTTFDVYVLTERDMLDANLFEDGVVFAHYVHTLPKRVIVPNGFYAPRDSWVSNVGRFLRHCHGLLSDAFCSVAGCAVGTLPPDLFLLPEPDSRELTIFVRGSIWSGIFILGVLPSFAYVYRGMIWLWMCYCGLCSAFSAYLANMWLIGPYTYYVLPICEMLTDGFYFLYRLGSTVSFVYVACFGSAVASGVAAATYVFKKRVPTHEGYAEFDSYSGTWKVCGVKCSANFVDHEIEAGKGYGTQLYVRYGDNSGTCQDSQFSQVFYDQLVEPGSTRHLMIINFHSVDWEGPNQTLAKIYASGGMVYGLKQNRYKGEQVALDIRDYLVKNADGSIRSYWWSRSDFTDLCVFEVKSNFAADFGLKKPRWSSNHVNAPVQAFVEYGVSCFDAAHNCCVRHLMRHSFVGRIKTFKSLTVCDTVFKAGMSGGVVVDASHNAIGVIVGNTKPVDANGESREFGLMLTCTCVTTVIEAARKAFRNKAYKPVRIVEYCSAFNDQYGKHDDELPDEESYDGGDDNDALGDYLQGLADEFEEEEEWIDHVDDMLLDKKSRRYAARGSRDPFETAEDYAKRIHEERDIAGRHIFGVSDNGKEHFLYCSVAEPKPVVEAGSVLETIVEEASASGQPGSVDSAPVKTKAKPARKRKGKNKGKKEENAVQHTSMRDKGEGVACGSILDDAGRGRIAAHVVNLPEEMLASYFDQSYLARFGFVQDAGYFNQHYPGEHNFPASSPLDDHIFKLRQRVEHDVLDLGLSFDEEFSAWNPGRHDVVRSYFEELAGGLDHKPTKSWFVPRIEEGPSGEVLVGETIDARRAYDEVDFYRCKMKNLNKVTHHVREYLRDAQENAHGPEEGPQAGEKFDEKGFLEVVGRISGDKSLCPTSKSASVSPELADVCRQHGFDVSGYVPPGKRLSDMEHSFHANLENKVNVHPEIPDFDMLDDWVRRYPIPRGWDKPQRHPDYSSFEHTPEFGVDSDFAAKHSRYRGDDVALCRVGLVVEFLSHFRRGSEWDATQSRHFETFSKALASFHKASHPGFYAAMFGAHTKEELRTLGLWNEVVGAAMERIVLLAVVDPRFVMCMSAWDLCHFGLRSPVITKIKDEPHKANKVYGTDGKRLRHPRMRSILIQDSIDLLTVWCYHRAQNKEEIRCHQDGRVYGRHSNSASHLCSGPGMGFHPQGLDRLRELKPHLFDGQQTFTADAKGWDWTFVWFYFFVDSYRRATRVQWPEFMGWSHFVNGIANVGLCLTLKVYCVGTYVVETTERMVMCSGIFSTSSTNSACRSLLDFFARNEWVSHLSAGDDYVGPPVADMDEYVRRCALWGHTIRDPVHGVANFCSHEFGVEDGHVVARFGGMLKSLAKICYKGKKISRDQYCGLRYAARSVSDVEGFVACLTALAQDPDAAALQYEKLCESPDLLRSLAYRYIEFD